MGCDIHMFAEVKKKDRWENAGNVFSNEWHDKEKYEKALKAEDSFADFYAPKTEHPYAGRNYDLFAFLADVRNGYGFAGVDTGDKIKPIADPKGLDELRYAEESERLSDRVAAERYRWGEDGHSDSWFTVKELIEADWDQEITLRGVFTLVAYQKIKKGADPGEVGYCGDISGPAVVKLTGEQYEELKDRGELNPQKEYHIRYQWKSTIKKEVGSFYSRTLPELVALAKDNGGNENVRIVFWFDN